MSYPRKRALLACDFCRQRKRRCDGRKPICGNCAEAEADCHYQELPIQRLMAGNLPSAMAKRLERIEALLKVHSEAIAELTEGSKKGECAASGNAIEVGKGEGEVERRQQQRQQQQIAALEQSHEDIEHDIPAVLTYLATSGQHHNYSHAARQNRTTPGALSSSSALDSRVRKPPSTSSSSYRTTTTTTTTTNNSKHASTPDHHHHRLLLREDERDHKLTHLHAHVPSPPNSTSSAASATASVNGLSPPLHTIAPAPAPPSTNLVLDIPKPGISTSSLLAFPTLRSLVGGFPPDYFLRIEMQRANTSATGFSASAAGIGVGVGAGELDLPYLNRDVTDLLVTTFFAVVHPCHPLFGAAQSRRRERFLDVYEDVVRRGLGRDARSVLCLVVFALGAIASSSASSSTSSFSGSGAGAGAKRDVGVPGMEYFIPALQIMTILDAQTFTGDATLAAALVLGGVYLSYVREPVKSWKVVCMAGRQVQLCGMSGNNTNSDDDGEEGGEELLVQVACACYSLEQELYGEFGLPSSGVAGFVDAVFFFAHSYPHTPRFHAHEHHDASKYAEISLQRIIARAHDALYSPASSAHASSPHQQQQQHHQPSLSLPSALSIAADFERQLALWYDDAFAHGARSVSVSVSALASPEHAATPPTSDDRERTLRLRYWEARIVVLKPFLLFLAEAEADRRGNAGGNGNGEEMVPAAVFDKASACVESCRLYITAAAEMLKKPARHTWATCQLSLHAVLLCTIASMAPRLAHWVPDVAELQQCVMDGVGASAWAVPESSAEAGVWVVGDIRRRQRFCLGR